MVNLAIGLIVILWINYVTDFLMQSESQANNKHHSLFWLLSHVATYSLYFGVGIAALNYFIQIFIPINLLWVILLNGASHFVVDFITSKFNANFYKKKNIRGFLKMIGFDMLIHTSILIALTFMFTNLIK